jgi:hypothetical protein
VRQVNAKQEKRTGLRIRGARGHREVRGALIRYARWLRAHYQFPIRLPVYLSPRHRIITIDGHTAATSFFIPTDRDAEPYIRMATGDYPSLKEVIGRDSSLASFITSLSHEIIHYQQWIATGDVWERGVARKAVAMLRQYESTADRP